MRFAFHQASDNLVVHSLTYDQALDRINTDEHRGGRFEGR